MMLYNILILTMTFVSSFAGLFIKISTNSKTAKRIITNKYFYFGGCLYVIVAFFNMWIIRKLPYSVVVPFGSITYIWTIIIAHFFLGETINIRKIIGVLFIFSGVVCIAV